MITKMFEICSWHDYKILYECAKWSNSEWVLSLTEVWGSHTNTQVQDAFIPHKDKRGWRYVISWMLNEGGGGGVGGWTQIGVCDDRNSNIPSANLENMYV